jgi:Zn-dependent M28 family amino/carboxypeptidase
MRYVMRKKPASFSLVRVVVAVLGVMLVIWLVIAQPTLSSSSPSNESVDPKKLEFHVRMLSETFHSRNWSNISNLHATADYIARALERTGARVEEQVYLIDSIPFRNISALYGPTNTPRIIVGAHYDSHGVTPGADDNASGVAGLIELGVLLGKQATNRAIELVAYTHEEPPYFGTVHMGSAHHAAGVALRNEDIIGVIVLEMIGYFSDRRFSQSYPSLLLHGIYPHRGNFIAVVGRWDQGAWIKKVKAGMKGTTALPVHSIRAPASIPGIDFSDHRNYWPHGYQAVMLTDTAFYRNKSYHTTNDTPDRLDYQRLSDVVIATFETINQPDPYQSSFRFSLFPSVQIRMDFLNGLPEWNKTLLSPPDRR